MAPDRFGDRRRDPEEVAKLLDGAIDEHGDLELSKLTDHLRSEDPEQRASASWALAEAARDRPRQASHAAEDLVAILADDDQWVRRGASWALSRIATTSPRAVREGVSAMTERLSDGDPLVRENASQAVAAIAETYPSRARPATQALAERLEDEDPLVRRYAAEALGYVLASDEIDLSNLNRPTVHRLAEFERLTQKDISVFDAFENESSVQQIADDGPPDGPASGGPATPVGPEEAEELSLPENVPDAPSVRVEQSNVERVGGIGTGRTGVVHRARVATETDDHIVVALKRLRREKFVDDTTAFDETFDRVTAGWQRLADHDYVVSLLGAGRTPHPWLAIEYMDAGSLRERIGQVGFAQATWLTLSIVRAVSHAHAQGVVHGGLRPSNVLFSQTLEGTWDVPKVTDWGLAQCFSEHATSRRWLDPTYAAPEQLTPDRFGRPDHATDVYQLGTLTYELFAGRPPFAGAPAEIAHKVVGDEPRPITDVARGLPDDLDRVLTRALAKRKPERYETVDDLRRELELFANEHAPDVFE